MRISELLQRGKRFGRLPTMDPRNAGFTLKRLEQIDQIDPATLPAYKHWMMGPILDQGDKPECVEFSIRQFLATGPIKNRWRKESGWLYKESQKDDGIPGENYDGTTVLGGMKVTQREKFITVYAWGEEEDDVRTWVKTKGPIVAGTVWQSGMMRPDTNGFIRATGWDEGGHAYCIKGANDRMKCPDGTRGAYRIANSWGARWGEGGLCWISYGDFAKLLEDWGEAATATEIRFVEEK